MGRFVNSDSVMGMNDTLQSYNLFSYCGNNPISRYDIGGDSWKDFFREAFHAGNAFLMAIGIDTAAVGAALLDMYKDKNGIYHARFNCWQRFFGYNEVYDFFFDIGTWMVAYQFPFTYNHCGYTIWAWKGDYINLGAGAELGIYRGNRGHRVVDRSLAMQMSMIVIYRGAWIINYAPQEPQWWITAFNPSYQNANPKELIVNIGVYFYDYGMYWAFRSSGLKYNTNYRWYFNDRLGFAIFQY